MLLQDIPIIRDTMAVMICRAHSVHTIGDHHVWYGEVLHAYTNGEIVDPLLYYARFSSFIPETSNTGTYQKYSVEIDFFQIVSVDRRRNVPSRIRGHDTSVRRLDARGAHAHGVELPARIRHRQS